MFFQQDTVIFERLQDKQMYMDSTVEHLEDFAKEGKWTTSTIFVKSSSVSPNSFRFLLTNQKLMCTPNVLMSADVKKCYHQMLLSNR